MNQVTLCGNVGSDPDIRNLPSGKIVATFSLATTDRFKDRTTGESKSATDWHTIVLWEGLCNIAEKYIRKGNKLLVTGRIKTRSWEKDGQKKYATEIIGDSVELLSDKPAHIVEIEDFKKTPVLERSGVPKDNSTDDLPF